MMLQKIIDCKCLENSEGNVYDRVCFSKYASHTDYGLYKSSYHVSKMWLF